MTSFLVETQPWVADAVCLGADTETFFDDKVGTAFRICEDCPVRTQCCEWALDFEGTAADGRYGVYGSTTPEQREVIARRGGLKGRDPIVLCSGLDGKRRIPAIPLNGVPWSRHHTTLARKLNTYLKGCTVARVPSVPALCYELGCNPVPLRHVLDELWAIGVLDKRSGFVYRGGSIDSLLSRTRGTTE